MVVTVLATLFPVYWLVQSSLNAQQDAFEFLRSLFPFRPDLTGYREMLPAIAPALRNSAFIAGGRRHSRCSSPCPPVTA